LQILEDDRKHVLYSVKNTKKKCWLRDVRDSEQKTHNWKSKKKIAEQNNTLVENVCRGLYHGYVLSRVIHHIQSEKKLFGNPDWYIEWLGKVNQRYPA
jgi:hypothetical protein